MSNFGKKIAFSGTHGTGKTTSVFQATLDAKMNYHDRTVTIFTENARSCPFPINKEAGRVSQLWIFCNQLQKELRLQSKFGIVICDRSICDSIAYARVIGQRELADAFLQVARYHMHTYDEIFFKLTKNNNYWFEDGLRDAKDSQFRLNVENEMLDVYDTLSKKYDCEFKFTLV